MPQYAVECQKCGFCTNADIPLADLDLFDRQESESIRCPECKGQLKRLILPVFFKMGALG